MAAVLGRNRHTKPAAIGYGPIELGWEFVRLILLHPVLIVEFPRQLGDRLADQLLVIGQVKIHSIAGHWKDLLGRFMHRLSVSARCAALAAATGARVSSGGGLVLIAGQCFRIGGKVRERRTRSGVLV